MTNKSGNPTNHSGEKKHKEFYKELKGPDAFQKKAIESLSLLDQNKKVIVGASVSLLVLIAGGLGWSQWQSSQRTKLESKLAVIEQSYAAEAKDFDQLVKDLQKNLDALTTEKQTLELVKDPDEKTLEEIKGKQAKIDQIQAKLDTAKPVHTASMKAYEDYYNQHPDQPFGFAAGLKVAAYKAEQGEPEASRKILDQIVLKSKDFPIYQVQGRFLLLSLLEDLKSYEEAEKVASDLMTVAPKEAKPKVLLTKSRILIEQKKHEDALKVLDQLLTEYGDSREADSARTYKALVKTST